MILPASPVPFNSFAKISCSLIIAEANGVAFAPPKSAADFTVAFGVSETSSLVAFTFASPFTEVSIIHTISPTATVSPSPTTIFIVPLSSAGNSKVALSESISAIA